MMTRIGRISIATICLLWFMDLSITTRAGAPSKPEGLAPPQIMSQSATDVPALKDVPVLYEDARAVNIKGLIPRAQVAIYANGKRVGGGGCPYEACNFDIEEKIYVNDIITATQTIDGVTSYPTRNEDAPKVISLPKQYLDPTPPSPRERLLPPVIGSPLFACQKVVPVTNTAEGALVRAFKTDGSGVPNAQSQLPEIGKFNTPWNYARPLLLIPLEEGQTLTASQEMVFPKPSNYSESKTVGSTPSVRLIPDPKDVSLVVGNNVVLVENLEIGADVRIFFYPKQGERQLLREAVAQWSPELFVVGPYVSACEDCLQAEQSFCGGIPGTSARKSVRDSFDPPVIKGPICAGSDDVTVCNTVPNGILTILQRGNPDPVSYQGAGPSCTPVKLGGSKVFNDGDEVYAREKMIDSDVEKDSAAVKVVSHSRPLFDIEGGPKEGPIFVGNELVGQYGPVFAAKMCGAERVTVDIYSPSNALVEHLVLEEKKRQRGYFEGTRKNKWSIADKLGQYTARFRADGGNPHDKYFYVTSKGCAENMEMQGLCAHNRIRLQVNRENPNAHIQPLKWSEPLAKAAQDWAKRLVETGKEEHASPEERKCVDKAGSPTEETCQGENLMFGDPAKSYQEAAEYWKSFEKECFKNGVFSDIYNGKCEDRDVWTPEGETKCKYLQPKDKWLCAGHYSQVIWEKTREVGCSQDNGTLACRYLPGGNTYTQRVYQDPAWEEHQP